MFTATTAAAIFASALMPLGWVVPPDDVPPPEGEITIDVATVNGSGCPKDTAAVALSEDKTAFTVTYSEYLAVVGPDSSPTDSRKNCQLNLRVNVPQGFTYGIASADYRGYANLADGATAMEQATYYFQGMEETDSSHERFSGPMDDNWQVTDETEVGAIVYKPCGEQRNFNINTELRVDAAASKADETSYITMDSTDGDIRTTYRFAWKECPAES